MKAIENKDGSNHGTLIINRDRVADPFDMQCWYEVSSVRDSDYNLRFTVVFKGGDFEYGYDINMAILFTLNEATGDITDIEQNVTSALSGPITSRKLKVYQLIMTAIADGYDQIENCDGLTSMTSTPHFACDSEINVHFDVEHDTSPHTF